MTLWAAPNIGAPRPNCKCFWLLPKEVGLKGAVYADAGATGLSGPDFLRRNLRSEFLRLQLRPSKGATHPPERGRREDERQAGHKRRGNLDASARELNNTFALTRSFAQL